MIQVTITIENAETVANDLADLLCWWEGFKMGLKAAGVDHFIVAEHGIDASRELNVSIKKAIKEASK